MYLKSIEIQGFKSFANKILFEFHNGITGIVGPNGSGKSNVADAVRWVLGEQRVKQLRGGSMQDVIFAGTETRKPQGFAYVAITLDNSDHALAIDYQEVTISRRLYRSGESEYLLNGTACRLKDINELFYDTGIGKEGYSIIGQGQIDKILSGRPEERRELFDEAAGIVKFKRRKAMAQKNLEDESQNLLRVSDVLAELERQVGPLKRQSEAAKEYLRLREQLRVCEANLFLLNRETHTERIQEIEQKETIAADELHAGQERLDAVKSQYEEHERHLEELEVNVQKTRQTLQDAEIEKNRLEGQVNVLREQIRAEQMNAEHIKNRLTSIQKELTQKEEQKKDLLEKEQEMKASFVLAENQLEEAESAFAAHEAEVEWLEAEIERRKMEMMELLNGRSSLHARQQRYDAMLEQVQVRHAEVSQRLLRFKTDEVNQELQMKEQQKVLDEINETIQEIVGERETTETILQELEEEIRKFTRQQQDAQRMYHATATKLESLKNIAERYEGYGNSIRRVMEQKGRVSGIHGVVADLIATEKRFETAIETALGGSIQNIVTDSEECAKELIAYLKKNKYGRATFLPLTSIGNKTVFQQSSALKEEGVLGLANTLVQADRQYEGLLKYLLGRVVVVDTIDHAIALARKFQYTFRIVTLEGELLSAGGSMTGGAFKNSSNLLGRKREIEDLERQCQNVLQTVEETQKALHLHEELLAVQKEELEAIKQREQEAYIRQNTERIGMEQMEQKKADILENASDLIRENAQLEEQTQEMKSNKQTLGSEIKELDDKNRKIQDRIAALQTQLDTEKTKREEFLKVRSTAQVHVAEQRQNSQFARENLNRVNEEEIRLKEEFDELMQGTAGTDGVILEKESQIEATQAQIQGEEEKKTSLKDKMDEQETQKTKMTTVQKRLIEERESLGDQINGLDKELYRLRDQKEKLAEKIDASIAYLWNEYELTASEAEHLKSDEWNIALGTQTRGELKTRIADLGHVNVHSISEYTELSERYEFMKTQHDDLVKAKDALLTIIEELDSGMRRQFEEKFEEIRKEFDKVFKEMFGGGHGELELMEGDLLETGIQIISQPPGKKLQNMMQLSGGEKALTAIALLFAIQNLKPSPFCLLDEIEAALDDSNVDRFARYLHKLTNHTQFIVITHRRGTMVSADRLYGITMQEKGVSALVSVSLIEEELEQTG